MIAYAMAPPETLMKIDHIALWTLQLEEMKAFYCRYFSMQAGNKYTNPSKKFESYFLSCRSSSKPHTRLELMQSPNIPPKADMLATQVAGFIHLAINVGSKEKVDLLTQELADDGYEIVSPPRYTGDGYYESCILDPDLNRIELTI